MGLLNATLAPVRSNHAITVVRFHADELPVAATWLRIRPDDDQPMPAAIVPDGSTANGSWFPRNHGGVQEFAFAAAETFNAGSYDGVPPCPLTPHQTRRFVLEAWAGRPDVDGSRASAQLLLASSGGLTFTFDDDGFAASQPFGDFSAAELGHCAGCITVTAAIANATAFAQAGLVTWFGFRALTDPPAGKGGLLPYFALDSMLLGDQYSTRGNFSNTVNITFSNPGTYFVGIYGAWNGEYGFWFAEPGTETSLLRHFMLPPPPRIFAKTGSG
jgi:hypothetical protein